MLPVCQLLQRYMISSIITLSFRWRHWGPERLRNLLSISQRVSGWKEPNPEFFALTIVCMVQWVLVIFIIFLFCTLGVFFSLFHTSHVISSTQLGSAGCLSTSTSWSKQAQFARGQPISLFCGPLFEGCLLTTETGERTDSSCRCIPRKVSAIPFRSPGCPKASCLIDLGFCKQWESKWVKGWKMVLKGQLSWIGGHLVDSYWWPIWTRYESWQFSLPTCSKRRSNCWKAWAWQNVLFCWWQKS